MLLPVIGWRTSSPGVTIQNSSPDLQPAVVPGVQVKEVVLGEVGLLGAVLAADDLSHEVLVVRSDVPEAGDFALEAEGLGRGLRGLRRRGRLDPGDLGRGLRQSAALELGLLCLPDPDPDGQNAKCNGTGKSNGEAHGDSLKNMATCGFWPKSYWFPAFVSTAAASGAGVAAGRGPAFERAFFA